MPKKRIIELQFPAGGIDRSLAYRYQPPFTTPDCENVWPRDVLEDRRRGGTRPGLNKTFQQQLGSGNPIRLLAPVSIVDTTGFTFWSDQFEGEELGGVWAAGWSGTAPSITDEQFADASYNTTVRAVRSALDPVIDTTQNYYIELYIVPYQGQQCGTYRIFARMNDSTPNAETEGIIAELTMTGSTTVVTSGSVKVYSGGVLQATLAFTTTSCPTVAQPGYFRIYISGTTIKAYWCGIEMLNTTDATALTGKRVGFGMTCSVAGGYTLVDTFRIQYYKATTTEMRRTLLVASSNGIFYKESFLGEMAAVSSNLTLASDRQVDSVECSQILYIADHGDYKTKGTTGSIDASAHLTKGGGGLDWTALGINAYDDVVVISNHSASGDGTFPIGTIAAGYIVATGATAGTCSWRVERGPKKYDPVANTLTMWMASAGLGQLPTGCTLIERYRGRLCLAAPPDYPNDFFMARVDDPLDWLDTLNEDDTTRPFSSAAEDTAGVIGEPLTAMKALKDDYMMFASTNNLHMLRGDPCEGGRLDCVTRDSGVIARNACCMGSLGEFWYLSRDGMCVFAPDNGIVRVSRNKMPKELMDVDAESFAVSMRYNSRFRGINVWLTGKSASKRRHWFFDLDNKGFFPDRYADAHEPFCSAFYNSLAAENVGMVVGCRDGYLRRYHESYERDDSTAISSYIQYGPLMPGGNLHEEALISQLLGILDAQSGNVAWSVQVGETIEAALNAAAFDSGVWTAGRNYYNYPRARAAAMFLKIANSGVRPWAVESICAELESGGLARKH